MQWIIVIAIVCLVGWLSFGWFKPDTYTGYFYKNPDNMDIVNKQSGFNSLDACRGWVNNQIRTDNDGYYDYECGKNCRITIESTVDRCETTER